MTEAARVTGVRCRPAAGLRPTAAPIAIRSRPPIRALSADAALLRRLRAQPAVGRVHSVFEHVVNIDIGDGRLLTLAHRDSDDAPVTVVVDVDAWPALDVVAGTGVKFSADAIQLGHAVVAHCTARPWHGHLPGYASDDKTLRVNVVLAQEHLERHGKGIGLERAVSTASTALDQAMVAAFRHGTQGLYQALARGDETRAVEHVGQLVGLGPGLTPAGDDFLLGLLAALNVPGSPQAAWRRIGAPIVACAARQTHPISAAALGHAANGRVRDRIIALCRALMLDAPTAMLGALYGVMRIGSSSGTEVALGVLAGFRLHLDIAPTHRIAVRDEPFGGSHGQ